MVERRNRDSAFSVVKKRLLLSKSASLLPSPSSPPWVARVPFEVSLVSVEQEVQVRRPLRQSRVMIDGRRHQFDTYLPHLIDSVHRKSLHPLQSLPPAHLDICNHQHHLVHHLVKQD